MERCILSIIIPGMAGLIPKGVAETKLRMAPEEVVKLRLLVAAKRQEALNYNAGRGGGSTPMRTVTKS